MGETLVQGQQQPLSLTQCKDKIDKTGLPYSIRVGPPGPEPVRVRVRIRVCVRVHPRISASTSLIAPFALPHPHPHQSIFIVPPKRSRERSALDMVGTGA